jgi:hypothetical protein
MNILKQILLLLFLMPSVCVCMDEEWRLVYSSLRDSTMTIEKMREDPGLYKEIEAPINGLIFLDGHHAFKKTEFPTTFGQKFEKEFKEETTYYFDEEDKPTEVHFNQYRLLNREEPTIGARKKRSVMQSGFYGLSWSSMTKILGGSLLVGLLIYGIKKIYDRKSHGTL